MNIDLKKNISEDKKNILYGAGVIGEMCEFAFRNNNLKVDYFCDASIEKQGKKFKGIKILSPQELEKFKRNTNIFISNNYFPH